MGRTVDLSFLARRVALDVLRKFYLDSQPVDKRSLSFLCVVRWRLWVSTGLMAGGVQDRSSDDPHVVLLRAASWSTTVHCYGGSRGAQDQSGALVRLLLSPCFEVVFLCTVALCWRSKGSSQWQATEKCSSSLSPVQSLWIEGAISGELLAHLLLIFLMREGDPCLTM